MSTRSVHGKTSTIKEEQSVGREKDKTLVMKKYPRYRIVDGKILATKEEHFVG